MKAIKFPKPEVDLRGFRLSRIREPQYRHFIWLIFWPIYYLRYFIVEAINPAGAACHVMHCALDDVIPLCEYFLIPYGLWMVLLLAMTFFTMLYDVDTFRRYMKYLTVAIVISTTTFLVYPTCQNLRPETFQRDNLFTKILSLVYLADTSTNVCPSEHVIGALALLAAACHSRYFKTPLRLTAMTVTVVLVCLSTLFLKQHSVLDVLWALPVCMVAWMVSFSSRKSPAILPTSQEKARGNI